MMLDQYCVFGNPIAHSKSPLIHKRFAELTGECIEYTAQQAPFGAFVQTMQEWCNNTSLGLKKGANVTVPFKFDAFALANNLSDRATLAGSCNTLSFTSKGVYGDNTDGAGLVQDLQVNAGVHLQGLDILLLGAGGAAAGVLGPMLLQRPKRVLIANRSLDRALSLTLSHSDWANVHGVELMACSLSELDTPTKNNVRDFDVVINATATSLAGQSLQLSSKILKPKATVFDMMYGKAAEGFLNWAKGSGALTRDGLGMLVEQAAEAFFIWRGVRPPSQQVLAEIRDF